MASYHRRTPESEDDTEVVVSRFGKIEPSQEDFIIGLVRECYNRLEPHDVSLVDLYLFSRWPSMQAFLTKEVKKVGVVSAPFHERFFAMHDAWRGLPRIMLCLERMKTLPELVQIGGIRHEVGHSVLHGSLQYYILPFPRRLRELADRFHFSSAYATNLLYLISIAVRDYEVSRLLYERRYAEDLAAYAKHMLAVTESDLASWEMAQGEPLAEAICLISSLKAAGCASPLLKDAVYVEEITRHLKRSISYFPQYISSLMSKVIWESFPTLGSDTFDNINTMLHRSQSIFETVFHHRVKDQAKHNM